MNILKDISIGRYVPGSSPLHHLDPRTKMVATLGIVIATFVNRGFIGYFWVLIFITIATLLSRLSFRFILRSIRPFVLLFSLTLILHLLFTQGHSIPPFPIWRLDITYEGLERGLYITFRLVLIVWGTTLLTLTTSPMDLTDGLERILRPLGRLRLPVGEIAMMVMIAIKFIPILLDEADRIIKAQRARGADFDTGGPIKRSRSMISLVIPMLVGVFRRADDLAIAMEARCYRSGVERTHLKVIKLEWRDWLAMGVVGGLLIGVLLIRYRFSLNWGF